MFKNILENLKIHFQEESLPERGRRMAPAALYGALIASAYTFALAFVNVYTFPKLPLGVDWPRTLGMWVGFSAAAALFGAVAAWFTEESEGIVGGGLVITALMAVVFLLYTGARNSTLTLQSIITALPLAGVCMLGAWGFRWMARRHLEIAREGQADLRRRQALKHALIVFLIGWVPGLLGRMDLPAEQTIGQLHELLQAAPSDPSVWPRLPLKKVPSLQEHFGVNYVLYPRQSSLSVGSLDVTVRFADGYVLTCLLPIGSGTSFITDCYEGETVQPNP